MKEDVGREFVLLGRSVSKGIGTGPAKCLFGKKRQFVFSHIEREETDSEVARFHNAVETATHQIREIIESNQDRLVEIFETHLLFLKDRSLQKKIENKIRTEKLNAEWAVAVTFEDYVSRYKGLTDKHIREKYVDLEDVGERLLGALGADNSRTLEFESGCVLIAAELTPSTLVELAKSQPSGIVTTMGGWTSHSFILAREMGIPAVTGIRDVIRQIKTGNLVTVDGTSGKVIVQADSSDIYGSTGNTVAITRDLVETPEVETKDGRKLRLSLNLDIGGLPESPLINRFDIGLYRSEFLFQSIGTFPSMEIQESAYRSLFELSDKARVNIRTFDINAQDQIGYASNEEKNPALGLRGIRFALRDEKQIRLQIRALLSVGQNERLGIVIPMVSDVSEIREVRRIVEEEAKSLNSAILPKIGAMIELPAAVFQIEEILSEVDFINIGTNDLVQYTLGVDRDNDSVADYFRTLHPAILKSLEKVFSACKDVGKEAIVCGETAGSAFYCPLLIGLGASRLSMNPQKTKDVAAVAHQIRAVDCDSVAQTLLECVTQDSVEEEIRRLYNSYWPNLDVLHR